MIVSESLYFRAFFLIIWEKVYLDYISIYLIVTCQFSQNSVESPNNALLDT